MTGLASPVDLLIDEEQEQVTFHFRASYMAVDRGGGKCWDKATDQSVVVLD